MVPRIKFEDDGKGDLFYRTLMRVKHEDDGRTVSLNRTVMCHFPKPLAIKKAGLTGLLHGIV